MYNIYCVAKSFLNFLKFCGLFTSSFDGYPYKGKFVFKTLNCIMSILNLIFMSSSFLLPFNFDRKYILSTDILATAWEILSNIEVFTYIFSLIYQLCKQSNIKNFLILVNEFDNQVRIVRQIFEIVTFIELLQGQCCHFVTLTFNFESKFVFYS